MSAYAKVTNIPLRQWGYFEIHDKGVILNFIGMLSHISENGEYHFWIMKDVNNGYNKVFNKNITIVYEKE